MFSNMRSHSACNLQANAKVDVEGSVSSVIQLLQLAKTYHVPIQQNGSNVCRMTKCRSNIFFFSATSTRWEITVDPQLLYVTRIYSETVETMAPVLPLQNPAVNKATTRHLTKLSFTANPMTDFVSIMVLCDARWRSSSHSIHYLFSTIERDHGFVIREIEISSG